MTSHLPYITNKTCPKPSPVSVQWSCYKVNISHGSLPQHSPCQFPSPYLWITLWNRLSLPPVTHQSITSGRECEGSSICLRLPLPNPFYSGRHFKTRCVAPILHSLQMFPLVCTVELQYKDYNTFCPNTHLLTMTDHSCHFISVQYPKVI